MLQNYNQQQLQIYNIQKNLQDSQGSKAWFVERFSGMAFMPANTVNPNYGSLLINCVPEISKLTKSPGIDSLGVFQDTAIYSGLYENLFCGKITVRRKGDFFFCMIRNKVTKLSDFYTVKRSDDNNKMVWKITNPTGYKFKGENFDFAKFKSQLYICSGEEDYKDSGLLCFDFADQAGVWSSIPTGKAAPVDQTNNSKKIEGDLAKLYGQLENFNPSIIEEYQDRLLISGAIGNPYQVKVSEFLNPKNFVDNVLGYAINTLTLEDQRKTSTFFCNEPIISLTTFSEAVFVGTENKFYEYRMTNLNDQQLSDRLVVDDSTNNGTVSNKSIKVFRGEMYYGSDYQVLPELNQKKAKYQASMNGSGSIVYEPGQKISHPIDEFMKDIDISNSCLGSFKNSLIWSVRKNGLGDDSVNNIAICYSRLGNEDAFYILDYVHSNWFSEIGGDGLIYSSSDNGLVYRFSEQAHFIRENYLQYSEQESLSNVIRDFTTTYQSAATGVSPRDSAFNPKEATEFYINGSFSDGTIINVQIFSLDNSCKGSCDNLLWEKNISIEYEKDMSCSKAFNIYDFNNTRYFLRRFKPEIGDIFYTQLYFKLNIYNSENFYLSSFGGAYKGEGSADHLIIDCNDMEKAEDNRIVEIEGEELVIRVKACGC